MKMKDKELTLADKTRLVFAGLIKGTPNRQQVARWLTVLLEYVLFDTPMQYTVCDFLLVF